MKKPLVSIVCTNYNKGDWICEAIDSFLRQKTNFSYEIILIDDKSTDKSLKIIKDYAEKYPDKIRAFYNDDNLGITKTWIKICTKARGKYIARCDGDDYWVDDNKLQKQVDLLESNKDSKWCNTDFDIVNADGEMTAKSAFENKIIKLADTYEKMLITKGFTMASTWLVDTKLMLSINNELDQDAKDDTFNIQLDLFQKTKLTYLPEPTTAYRLINESDSHTIDIEKMKARQKKLISTQKEYINKYRIGNDQLLAETLEYTMELENTVSEYIDEINKLKIAVNDSSSKIKELECELLKEKEYKIKYEKTINYKIKKAIKSILK